MDLRRPFEDRPELSGTRVIAAPVAVRRPSVQRVPQELVAEVEVARIDGAEVVQEPVIDQLLEGHLEVLFRYVHDLG